MADYGRSWKHANFISDFPITESISQRTIALPFYNNLTKDDIALEPIRITPEWPIYSEALMPLKGFTFVRVAKRHKRLNERPALKLDAGSWNGCACQAAMVPHRSSGIRGKMVDFQRGWDYHHREFRF